MTIWQALQHGEKILAAADVDQPRWTAERLLLLALGKQRPQLYANWNSEISERDVQRYEELLQKRAQHYPLAYLEGSQEFFGRSFLVNESVLIPRPETEVIVRAVLELDLPLQPCIVDFGAGSGNIALTLANEISDSFVVAVEISSGAIEVLKSNSRGRIGVVQADLFRAPFLPASVHVITANLPYVEESTSEELPRETRWEPQLALITKDLELSYTRLLEAAASLLRPAGYLVFEIGYGQSERIDRLCRASNQFRVLEIRSDMQGIPRVFVLQA